MDYRGYRLLEVADGWAIFEPSDMGGGWLAADPPMARTLRGAQQAVDSMIQGRARGTNGDLIPRRPEELDTLEEEAASAGVTEDEFDAFAHLFGPDPRRRGL